ncbi:MAG TPA: hypothetical protein VKX16_10110, partial [Chloroflexota bacterium]|nr:hypothetical protein [Chloroflexota bacterium]
GGSFLYANTGTGTSCGSGTNFIDVFNTSGGLLQAFADTANECANYFGSNQIAVLTHGKKPTSACLVEANLNAGAAPGSWLSFTIPSTATGLIGAQVSTVADPKGTPEDVKAAPEGNAVYSADFSGSIERLAVNPKTCALGKPKYSKAGPSGTVYVNLQVLGKGKGEYIEATNPLNPNVSGGTIDSFKTSLALAGSAAPDTGAGASYPDGISAFGNQVATGTLLSPGIVEDGTWSAPSTITWAGVGTDPNGYNESNTALDATCVWGGNEGIQNSSGADFVSAYAAPGTFVNEANLLGGTLYSGPMQVVNAGGVLLVDNVQGGLIDLLTVGSGCSTSNAVAFAAMNDAGGNSGGMEAVSFP